MKFISKHNLKSLVKLSCWNIGIKNWFNTFTLSISLIAEWIVTPVYEWPFNKLLNTGTIPAFDGNREEYLFKHPSLGMFINSSSKIKLFDETINSGFKIFTQLLNSVLFNLTIPIPKISIVSYSIIRGFFL